MAWRLLREDQFIAWLVAAGALSSVFLGVLSCSLQPRTAGLAVVLVVAVWAATRPWGGVVVFAPVALLPSFPELEGIDRLIVASGVTWTLVVIHWSTGAGRPRLKAAPLVGVAVLAGYALIQAVVQGLPAYEAVAAPSLWAAGIVLGFCLAAQREGALAVGLFGAGAGALAIAELTGVPNLWHQMTGGSFEHVGSFGGAQRAFSTFGHPLVAGVAIATCGALALNHRTRLLWMIVPLCVAGAVATVSRSAMLGMVGAALVVLLQSKSKAPQVLGAIVVTLAVTVGIMLAVPEFGSSVSSRLTGERFQQQDVREFAVQQLASDVSGDFRPLLFGGGIGTPGRMLDSIGGIGGFRIFDNQYLTAIYDFGLVPLLVALVIVALGLSRSGVALVAPAAAVLAISLWFFDGLAWASVGVLAGAVVGMAAVDSNLRWGPSRPKLARPFPPSRS